MLVRSNTKDIAATTFKAIVHLTHHLLASSSGAIEPNTFVQVCRLVGDTASDAERRQFAPSAAASRDVQALFGTVQ